MAGPTRRSFFSTAATLLFLLVLIAPRCGFGQIGGRCAVCGQPLGYTVWHTTDAVEDKKVWVCDKCNKLDDNCFACGLPVQPGGKVLQDGRHYCPRDGERAITEPAQMGKVVTDTIDQIETVLRYYITFPTGNLSVDMIDRINLEAMFARAGNDYACPDLRGYYQSITNNAGERTHSIHLMTGFDHASTRNTLVHEIAHAWIAENVPPERELGRLAQEGFCELVAYLVAEKIGDEKAIKQIEKNAYTRGQFALFKEAKRRYEIHALLAWLTYGSEPIIDSADIDHVRRVTRPAKAGPKLWVRYSANTTSQAGGKTVSPNVNTSATPAELELKGILGNGTRRLAMISGKSFMVGESGKVTLGMDKVEIRCVEIGSDFVQVEMVATGETKELRLKFE